jgi:hypothetical protein
MRAADCLAAVNGVLPPGYQTYICRVLNSTGYLWVRVAGPNTSTVPEARVLGSVPGLKVTELPPNALSVEGVAQASGELTIQLSKTELLKLTVAKGDDAFLLGRKLRQANGLPYPVGIDGTGEPYTIIFRPRSR